MRTKSLLAAAAAVTAAAGLALVGTPAAANPAPASPSRQVVAIGGPTARYVVLAADGVSVPAATAAIGRLGGRVVASNPDIGTLTVDAPAAGF
ncbi:MAG TPA: hypothetical protein VMU51_17205, partial [Mycobacteriales bacterium]|nr:hypothetical protein [Mycobacteriales bacterium]